jgi:hypothetical protein
MKCLCGYEYVSNFDEQANKGDEAFIEIELSNSIQMQIYKGMGDYEKVSLKACPKCKTVKMASWLD